MGSCCSVLELRQYTLHPGQRDALIELFDREFVESQEALGAHVVGQFRDLDRPDRFVWIRGFASMEARRTALEGFYGGPVWAQHRDAANATMIDFDDVHLLRPAVPGSGLAHGATRDLPTSDSVVRVSIWPVRPELDDDEVRQQSGAWFVTLDAENTFPALPIHTGEPVLVAVTSGTQADPEIQDHPAPTRLRLAPTSRSQLR